MKKLILLIGFSILLSGCLYPESQREENQISNEVQVDAVQQAIDTYKEDNQGLVPIRTKPNDTPIFQKYLIDFNQLQNGGYLSEIPESAYENGGVYQYGLLTPEKDPRVRVIDLRITEAIRDVNLKMSFYRDDHTYPAYGEKLANGIYTVNQEKLQLEEPPTVISPYSQQRLPIIMDVDGNLYVDYRVDLQQALKDYEHNYKEGDDIRYLLAEETPFLPAYSLPYTVKEEEPVFMLNE